MKKIICVFLSIILMLSMSVCSFADVGDHNYVEKEDNNSIGSANILRNDYTVEGKLTRYDLDYYVFTITKTSTIKMLCVSSERSLRIGLKDANNESIGVSNEEYRGDGIHADTIVTTLSPGKYYFVILNMDEYAYNNTYMFYFEIIPSAQHTHDYSFVTTEPTCTENGYTTYTCSCGDSYVDFETQATGHSFSEWSVTVEPTTENPGEETRVCQSCGETEIRSIPKIEESVDIIVGDVNADGNITAVDARMVLQFVAGLKTSDDVSLEVADMNGDGTISGVDARIILQIVAGLR